MILLNLNMLRKSCIILYILDASFGVWLWLQLNWGSMYMTLF